MIRGKAEITLSYMVDITSATQFCLPQSSTNNIPAKPTSYLPGNWILNETSYNAGATNILYLTKRGDSKWR